MSWRELSREYRPMDVDPQDFERHYASLSDDALLEINRDDLIEIAQDRLDRELARRGLSRSKAAVPGGLNPNSEAVADGAEGKDGAVVVSNFTYPDEAAEARDALEAAGIRCYLTQGTGEDQPRRRGLGSLLLMVPSSYVDRALAVLQEEFGPEEDGPLPSAEESVENDAQ
jgi:hypothetical protein